MVEQTYARALLELAQQAGQAEEIGQELEALRGVLRDQPRLGDLLGSRVIPVEERSRVVERVFNGRVSELLYRFLQVACGKGRLGALGGIVEAYLDLLDEQRGVVNAVVETARPMTGAQSGQVAAGLGKMVGRQVRVREVVNPGLIGGLRVRVGDRLIDGSVPTRLKLMREKLLAAGDQKIRVDLAALLLSV